MLARLLSGAVAVLAATAAQAQRLGGAPEEPVSVARVMAALVLCLAAAFGLALVIKVKGGTVHLPLLKRAGWGRNAEQIEMIATRRLSLHTEIHIVRCREVEYVLLCGAHNPMVLERRTLAVLDASAKHSPDLTQHGGA